MTQTSPMLLRISIGVSLLVTGVTGCTSSTGYVIGVPRNDPPTRPAAIQVIDHADPHTYRVVGRVHAHTISPTWLPWGLASRDRLLKRLKKEAALLHADVIFDIKRYSRSQFEWREEHLMGTAAVLTKKDAGDAQ